MTSYRVADVVAVMENRISLAYENVQRRAGEIDRAAEKQHRDLLDWSQVNIPILEKALADVDMDTVAEALRHTPYVSSEVRSRQSTTVRMLLDAHQVEDEIRAKITLVKSHGETVSHNALKELGLLAYLRPARLW